VFRVVREALFNKTFHDKPERTRLALQVCLAAHVPVRGLPRDLLVVVAVAERHHHIAPELFVHVFEWLAAMQWPTRVNEHFKTGRFSKAHMIQFGDQDK
jgi:hypothetical protein